VITASLQDGERRTWQARYVVVLDSTYAVSQAGALDAAAQTYEPCLTEANRLFQGHVGKTLIAGKPRRIKAGGMTLRAPIIESEAPSRVILSDVLGLQELKPSTQILD
jgi:hypothetical protein